MEVARLSSTSGGFPTIPCNGPATFVPISRLGRERDGRTLILLDSDGQRRFGRWDADVGAWVSTVQEGLRLRPVAARGMPIAGD